MLRLKVCSVRWWNCARKTVWASTTSTKTMFLPNARVARKKKGACKKICMNFITHYDKLHWFDGCDETRRTSNLCWRISREKKKKRKNCAIVKEAIRYVLVKCNVVRYNTNIDRMIPLLRNAHRPRMSLLNKCRICQISIGDHVGR